MSYSGSCNGCGKCCQFTTDYGTFSCIYLMNWRDTGLPHATSCMIHSKRWLGMPIVMMREDGVAYKSNCYSTYPEKQDAVPPECSYKYEGEEQPQWFLGYTPKLPLVNITEKQFG